MKSVSYFNSVVETSNDEDSAPIYKPEWMFATQQEFIKLLEDDPDIIRMMIH